MNREILFRGKQKDNGEWVYGYYVCLNGSQHRIYTGYAETDCGEYFAEYLEVIPDTVGQYTGLTDKNEKKIFEGDILEFTNDEGDKSLYKVLWSIIFAGWVIKRIGMNCDAETMDCWSGWREYYEVVGNIHDNPELI